MGLWIFACDASEDEIQAACQVAGAMLKNKAIAPDVAQQAAIDAADLSTEDDTATPNADLVIAWYNAEYAAFEHIQAATGEWPNGASLIYVEQGE